MAAVPVTTISGVEAALGEWAVEEFALELCGELIRPDDTDYDGSRKIWNGMIDKRPAMIARCTGTADVVESVNFARENGLLLSIRGGGLMVDLSPMKGIWVDSASCTARAQPDVTLGELDHETQLHGLAAVLGFISTIGIAGLTLGGGFGSLSRKHGWTTDNLLSVEIVTADGRLLRASKDENADLFWAVRGGGGNFGVVTSFEYELHPVGPQILGGLILHPLEKVEEVFAFYKDFAARDPRRIDHVHDVPPGARRSLHTPRVAREARGGHRRLPHGLPGAGQAGPRAAQRVREPHSGRHQAKDLLPAAGDAGRHYYWKSEYLPGIEEEMVPTIVEHVGRITSPHSAVFLFQLGGVIGRYDEDATATGNRDVGFVLNIAAAWDPEPSETHVDWSRGLWQKLRRYSTGGAYVNFMTGDEGGERLEAAYHGTSYGRLVEVKTKYDPDNLFRVNQNIKPAS